MLDHHIQRSIIYKLSFTDTMRFSDLKPDDVESKLFTYHLKKAVASGLVIKNTDGLYALSQEGRRVSTGVGTAEQKLITERPYSVLLLVVRRKSDDSWLFYKRPIHPMLGYEGFMHANPSTLVDAELAAAQQCKLKTGLTGSFMALGGGYFRIYKGTELESFTHFTVLFCEDVEGNLADTDNYYWVQKPEFATELLFPGTEDIYNAYLARKPFFLERTFQLNEE